MSTSPTACLNNAALLAGLVLGLVSACLVSAQDAPTRSVWDGVYTQEQAARGQSLYGKECAGCHGQALSGGEEAPPLSGGAFLANWNGLTVGDLFERIRVSMPEGRPGTLSRQQNADVLAYILSGNQFPPGKSELPKETELVKQIKLEASRPEK